MKKVFRKFLFCRASLTLMSISLVCFFFVYEISYVRWTCYGILSSSCWNSSWNR